MKALFYNSTNSIFYDLQKRMGCIVTYERYSCADRGSATYNNPDGKGSLRRWYQHDIDLLVYSKPFRKMQKKTQLLSEKDPLCRSRLIHTLEVSRIAKEISDKLGLNSELTEAIALGHDLGNTAYGHISNAILKKKTNNSFTHELASSLMVSWSAQKKIPNPHDYISLAVQKLDKGKDGFCEINITSFPEQIQVSRIRNEYFYTCVSPETLDGIQNHGENGFASTLEGQVVKYSDNIAYLSQDIEDLRSSGIIEDSDMDYFESLSKAEKSSKHLFSRSSSNRIGGYIESYVAFNLDALSNNTFTREYSYLLKKEIPTLSTGKVLQNAIDISWKNIEGFYNSDLIVNSNKIKEDKFNVLWEILHDRRFADQNPCYKRFMRAMEEPIMVNFKSAHKIENNLWDAWKKAFFASYLSVDEIEVIIDSYQARDFCFELDI